MALKKLLLVVATVAVLCLSADAAKSDFDFYLFVQGWPGTQCLTRKCKTLNPEPTKGFLLHGLWPNRDDGTYPQFCSHNTFKDSMISSIEDEMVSYWPSLYNNNNFSFWKHEWEKHGTCAETLFKEPVDYFETSIKLRQKYDLLAALEKAGVTPGADVSYQTQQYLDVFKKLLGVDALLMCPGGKGLNEVWMCVDKKTLEPTQCSKSFMEKNMKKSQCSKKGVAFPAYDHFEGSHDMVPVPDYMF